MKIRIKVMNPAVVRSPVQREGDVGADVSSTVRMTVAPGQTARVPLGIALEIPEGYSGFILPRSGHAVKGLVVWSPPIDPGYRGEIHAIFYNSSRQDYQIGLGERVAQLVVLPVPKVEFDECSSLSETSRGASGFGSSGKGGEP